MLHAIYAAGLAFIFTLQTALSIPGIHFSPAHWAPKAGKECGRPIIDSTDSTSPYPVLNSEEVSERAQVRYGVIRHPTIDDVVVMVVNFLKKSVHGPARGERRAGRDDYVYDRV